MRNAHNKHIKNRPQQMWAGLAKARLLCGRYVPNGGVIWYQKRI